MVEEDVEILHAILASAQEKGWERVTDTNTSDGERIGFVPAMITNGGRNTAYSTFVRPVRGVSGLRVVDASVLPVQVAGNTQAPTMAVAWIAADLILEDS